MILLLFILGACAGSFAYAMTLRMFDGRDWVKGRSECEHCHKELKPRDLVPVFSWLLTLGKCRYCARKLGASYIAVELATAFLFAGSFYFWPYEFGPLGTVSFAVWLVTLTLLMSLVIFDLKWFLLPDKVVYTLTGLAAAVQLYTLAYTQDFSRLPNLFLGIIVGYGVFFLLYVGSSGRYIGGGDVKFGLFFGLLLGSGFKSLLVISIGSLIGTIIVLPSLITKKTKFTSQIPFGPSLIAATIIVYIFGDRILELMMTTYLFP